MSQMRPFQIVLIAVFAVLALVGLYVFSTFTTGGNPDQIGTVVIWGTLPDKAMADAINELKAAHKEYANVSYIEKQPASFDNDLANALASGTGPDLVIINQEELVTETPKLELIPFSSIPERTFLDTYIAEDQMYLTDKGTYGIPLVVDPLVLYYNRTLLSAGGVPTPPAAWSAVLGLVASLTKLNGQTVSIATVPFGGYANVTNARAMLSLLFLQAGTTITAPGNGRERSVLGDTNVGTDTTGRTPAEAAAAFYTEFADPGSMAYTWNPSLPMSRQAFLAGDLVLYPGFASEVAPLKSANPNLDFDMATIPQLDSATGRTTYGLAYAFTIPKVAANKAGAYSTAIALTGTAVLADLAKELGMAPAARALLSKTDPANPYTGVFYPEALNAKGWLSPAPAAVDQIFSAMISGITSGRYEIREALTNASQSLDVTFQ
jgi:ABC-type glycerol-3-phosphate transport system substrate-binding protein